MVEEKKTEAREKLYDKFSSKLEKAYHLNRQMVSFQANKIQPIYRWFKYKEGYSSNLVNHFLNEHNAHAGKVLDPFAGAGTTLFVGQEQGYESFGIELLPVGIFAMQVREAVQHVNVDDFKKTAESVWSVLDNMHEYSIEYEHIPITLGAFPPDTEVLLNKYLNFTKTVKDKNTALLLRLAVFSVLEEISFTRKDGQFLRWDHRSNRREGKNTFDKGKILLFKDAVQNKLGQMMADLSSPTFSTELFPVDKPTVTQQPTTVYQGSCLEIIPTLPTEEYDFIMTSPPYCNRYDYTRTYALELVFLGCNNDDVRRLRQEMLSCTVESKEKVQQLESYYTSIGKLEHFHKVLNVYRSCESMTEINSILDELNATKKLNNPGIARMVKNYFLEMCFVIFECSRVLKPNGHFIVVNDNVRYGGEEIPVDLILSEFAEGFGLSVNKIFVLPRGKGNSSQQMGVHGRTEVRKCVYEWQKK